MPLTLYEANRIQGYRLGQRTYTVADPIYVAVGLASQLAGASIVGATVVALVHPVSVGAKIVLQPNTASAEERVITAVSGSGPYSAQFTSELTLTHALNALVLIDPGTDGENFREPSGDNYARTSYPTDSSKWTVPSGGLTQNIAALSVPAPSGVWGWATHLAAFDASSAGHMLEWARLSSILYLDTAAAPISIPIGYFLSELPVNAL